tara:strand:+ start:4771 stop:5430 length:660 start_codon:yes stop_codon:yes gene_type:complete
MNGKSGNHFTYILALALLFGLLYLMKFVVPHYVPEDGPIDYSEISIQYEDDSNPETSTLEITEKSADKPSNEKANPIAESTNAEGFFNELKRTYQTTVLNRLPPGKPRTDVIIRYYKHPPDGNSVYTLKDLGFYIHERPVDNEMTDYESNSIFYGDSVKKEDLLIVAYTLLSEGLPIKSIKPSLYHDGWKYNSIEIGADSTVIEKEVLTLEQLKQLPLN